MVQRAELEDVWECPRCHREKPASEYYWTGGRRASYCRKCQNQYTIERRQLTRELARRRMYDLTPEGVEARMRSQGGVCAICGCPPETPARGGIPTLHTDHDHKTGEVRGLLCRKCNLGLGMFDDNIHRLQRAIGYLSGYTLSAQIVEDDEESPERAAHQEEQKTNRAALAEETPRATGALVYLHQLRSGWSEPRSLLADIDRMPYDEEQKSRPNGDFAKRRKDQMYALQAVFQHLFDQPLSNGQAKLLLQNTSDSAEDALDLMEDLQVRIKSGKTRPDAPASYLLGMAKRQRQEMTSPPGRPRQLAASPAAPGSSPSRSGASGSGSDGYAPDTSDDNYYLKEPTAKTKKIRDQIDAAIASGRLKLLEDDDD